MKPLAALREINARLHEVLGPARSTLDVEHPLTKLFAQVQQQVLQGDTSNEAVGLLGFLALSASMMGAWMWHPVWPDVAAKMCRDKKEDYLHTVATLGVASWLQDSGNDVELAPVGNERAADLKCFASAQIVNVEVKVPLALRWPGSALTKYVAEKKVRAAFQRAGVGVGGQLGPPRTGLLVIGGFGLTSADLDTLGDAMKRNLRTSQQRPHVLGGLVIAFSVFTRRRGPATSFARGTAFRLEQNPRYTGTIDVAHGDDGKGHPVAPDQQLMTLLGSMAFPVKPP